MPDAGASGLRWHLAAELVERVDEAAVARPVRPCMHPAARFGLACHEGGSARKGRRFLFAQAGTATLTRAPSGPCHPGAGGGVNPTNRRLHNGRRIVGSSPAPGQRAARLPATWPPAAQFAMLPAPDRDNSTGTGRGGSPGNARASGRKFVAVVLGRSSEGKKRLVGSLHRPRGHLPRDAASAPQAARMAGECRLRSREPDRRHDHRAGNEPGGSGNELMAR